MTLRIQHGTSGDDFADSLSPDRDPLERSAEVSGPSSNRGVYSALLRRNSVRAFMTAHALLDALAPDAGATLRATSFRLFLAIAAGRKLQVHQLDVTNAFTQAKMNAEIYFDGGVGRRTFPSSKNYHTTRLPLSSSAGSGPHG